VDDLRQRVYEVISRELGIALSVMRDDTPLLRGGDPFDIVELLMGVEDAFGIAIADADAERVRTVGDLVDLVSERLGVERPPRVTLPDAEALRKFRPAGADPAEPGIRETPEQRERRVRETPDRRTTGPPPSLASLPMMTGGFRGTAVSPARLIVLVLVLVVLAVIRVVWWIVG
jgi:acyl carrier protein